MRQLFRKNIQAFCILLSFFVYNTSNALTNIVSVNYVLNCSNNVFVNISATYAYAGTLRNYNNGIVVDSVAYNLTSGVTPQITLSGSGQDSLVAIDTVGGVSSFVFNYPINNPLSTTLSLSNNMCDSAIICPAVIGGVPPYIYSYTSNGSSTGILQTNGCNMVLNSGTYAVLVTDAMGCADTSLPIIVAINNITVTATISAINCFGTDLCLFAAGGTLPYTYSCIPNNGFVNAGNCYTITTPGVYTFVVVDANGCTRVTSAAITGNNSLNVNAIKYQSLCNIDSIKCIVTGGVLPYSLSVDGVVANNDTMGITQNVTIVVVDSMGCVDTFLYSFTGATMVAIPDVIDNNSCNSSAGNSVAAIKINNGLMPITYSWTNASGTGASALIDTAYNVPPTGATVVATSINGCTATATIVPSTANSMQINATKDTLCFGDSVKLSASSPSIPPVSYATVGSSIATSINDEEIYQVSIGGLNNLSSCLSTGILTPNYGLPASSLNRYSNYTNLTPPLLQIGAKVPISIGVGYCGSSIAWTNRHAVFIDLNRNGVFDLPQELVYYSAPMVAALPPGFTLVNDSITIPVTAVPGKTLMRVVLIESSITPSPTGVYTWGETEDYIIELSAVANNLWYNATTGVFLGTGNSISQAPTTTTTYFTVNTNNSYCNDTTYHTIVVLDTIAGVQLNANVTPASCLLSNDGSIFISSIPPTPFLTYNWSHDSVLNDSFAINLAPNNYNVNVYNAIGQCKSINSTVMSNNVNCTSISGYVYADNNSNCTLDTGDTPIINALIEINPGGWITYTDPSGYYLFNNVLAGIYTITQQPNLLYVFNNCSNNYVVSVNSGSPAVNQNFYDSIGLIKDYLIHDWDMCISPGADSNNSYSSIFFHNQSSSYGAAAIVFITIDSMQYFDYSIPAPTYISNDTLYYTYSTTSNTKSVKLYFNIPTTVQLGDSIKVNAGYISYSGLDTNVNNNFSASYINFCAPYDPNDKNVDPKGKTANGYITKADKDLSYLVRFQNTGNAPAVNVIVQDTISGNLDITTLKVIAFSHPYQIEVINNQLVKFKCLNIMLPDSGADYAGSQGFIAYTIQQKNTIAIGDKINNTAYIYFDNNAPIVTNATANTIYEPLVLLGVNTTRNTACNAPCGNGSVIITATAGVAPLIYSVAPNCSSTVVNGGLVTNLLGGIYTVSITDATGDYLTTTAVVQDPPAINPNLNVVQASSGTWGSAGVSPIGGTGSFTTTWLPLNVTGNTVSNLPVGTYTVIVKDAFDCIAEKVFTINTPNSIAQYNKGVLIRVYPNPSNGAFTIHSSAPIGNVIVTNTLGQKVMRIEAGNILQTDINLAHLPDGLYTIEVANSKSIQVQKVNK